MTARTCWTCSRHPSAAQTRDRTTGTLRDVTETHLNWRKSSRCGTSTCVEIAHHGGEYLIRDSKNPDQAPIRLDRTAWAGFLDAVKAGAYDRPQ